MTLEPECCAGRLALPLTLGFHLIPLRLRLSKLQNGNNSAYSMTLLERSSELTPRMHLCLLPMVRDVCYGGSSSGFASQLGTSVTWLLGPNSNHFSNWSFHLSVALVSLHATFSLSFGLIIFSVPTFVIYHLFRLLPYPQQ